MVPRTLLSPSDALWFLFALMTAAAIFAVLWPLGRGAGPQNDGTEATVYKDQLLEIERDLAAGLIGPSEAAAARVEISRRLLAADDAERKLPASSNVLFRRLVAAVALAGLPLLAVALYLPLGSPRLADFPLGRAYAPPAHRSRSTITVAQVEAHFEKIHRWPWLERAGPVLASSAASTTRCGPIAIDHL